MLAIVSVTNDLYTDNRVNKVCLYLDSLGYDVLLVGRKRRSSPQLAPRKYKTKRMKLLFEKGALFYAAFNIRLFLFLLFKKTDVLVSNDLDTLLANHLASKFKRKVKLVYDSHELFTEVPELTSRPKVQKFWLGIEKRILPQLKNVYTVNNSIANIYKEKYNIEIGVIRNISPKWEATEMKSKKSLGIPDGEKLLILQGAGINIDRGAEELIQAMQSVNAILMIVGDGDVLNQLKSEVKKLGLKNKVLFFGKRPYNEMMNFTHYADIGFTLDKPTNLNYKFSLPNKVFDYIHTNTAVIATEIIEVQSIVEKYNVGKIVAPFTSDNLAITINQLLDNKVELKRCKENCLEASKIENWESESQYLNKYYGYE